MSSPNVSRWALLVFSPDIGKTGIASKLKDVYSWQDGSITFDDDGTTYTVQAEVAPLFDLRWVNGPNEDSLEADWRGRDLNIGPRDVVWICTLGHRSGEASTTYYPRFRGYVTNSRNASDTTPGASLYRAKGIRWALYGKDLGEQGGGNRQYSSGNDIAGDIIDNERSEMALAADLYGIDTGSTISNIGVTSEAAINHGSVSMGEFADAMLGPCENGGVTAVWGVGASDGVFFFEERGTTTAVVTTADVLEVRWRDVNAEELVTKIRWAITDGTLDKRLDNWDAAGGTSPVLDTPDLLSHVSDSGNTTYRTQTRMLQPPDGLSPLTPYDVSGWTFTIAQGSLDSSYVGSSLDSPATDDNIHDGDQTSYSIFAADVGGQIELSYDIPNSSPTVDTQDIRGISFRARAASDLSNLGIAAYLSYAVSGSYSTLIPIWGNVVQTGDLSANLGYTDGFNEIDVFLAVGDRAQADSNTSGARRISVFIDIFSGGTSNKVAIEDFRVWKINTAELDGAAELEYKLPEEGAAFVRKQGEPVEDGYGVAVGAWPELINIDAAGDKDITQIETSITRAGGVETLFVVGEKPITPAAAELNAAIRARDEIGKRKAVTYRPGKGRLSR